MSLSIAEKKTRELEPINTRMDKKDTDNEGGSAVLGGGASFSEKDADGSFAFANLYCKDLLSDPWLRMHVKF